MTFGGFYTLLNACFVPKAEINQFSFWKFFFAQKLGIFPRTKRPFVKERIRCCGKTVEKALVSCPI